MSKFDAILKKIEEGLPPMGGTTGTAPTSGSAPQQTTNPALNTTQQQEVEKIADQLAKINDPTKIKDILASIMQGVTHPQNGVSTQQKLPTTSV